MGSLMIPSGWESNWNMIFKRSLLFSLSFVCLTLSFLRGQSPPADPSLDDVPPRMRILDNDQRFNIGDRFNYQVLEECEDPVQLFVNGQGEVNFPLAGRLSAVDKTPCELAIRLKNILEQDYFYQATVIIEPVTQTGSRGRVNLIGEVRTNGMQILPADEAVTLSEMILRSGGFTPQADQSEVRLVRQGGRGPNGENLSAGTYTFDVEIMLETGNFENDPLLIANDLIQVPKMEEVGGEYIILGAVNREGAYPIDQEGLTLSRAILAAGGFSRFAQDRRVRLIRTDESTGKNETFTVNVKDLLEGKNLDEDLEIEDGDIIRVDEKLINL